MKVRISITFFILVFVLVSVSAQSFDDYPKGRGTFDKNYREENRGRVRVQTPKVFELFHVVLALTRSGTENTALVQQNTEYYQQVLKHFHRYRDHAAVSKLQSEIENDRQMYILLKLNSLGFDLIGGEIVASSEIRYVRGDSNKFAPLVDLFQRFSKETNFPQFYDEQRTFYDRQHRRFRDEANVPSMLEWLNFEFPESAVYDSVRIVVSPLTSGYQHQDFVSDGDFDELVATVSIPTITPLDGAKVSKRTAALWQTELLFTELNHGFIGPATIPLSGRIYRALSERSKWVDDKKLAGAYGDSQAVFNEYLNWTLLSAFFSDQDIDERERLLLINDIENYMVESRGFLRFRQFNQFALRMYFDLLPRNWTDQK